MRQQSDVSTNMYDSKPTAQLFGNALLCSLDNLFVARSDKRRKVSIRWRTIHKCPINTRDTHKNKCIHTA